MVDPVGEDDFIYANGTLSDSTFVPIKTPESTESDDSSIRSVRFSKLAEVSFRFIFLKMEVSE